jgi:peptidoglycan hydrolase-like protein with peptidoglycan-binding domain
MRTVFGKGSFGDLVRQVQTNLTQTGFNTNGVDGEYGSDTVKAVSAFQQAKGASATGTLDDGTWGTLMAAPLPPVAQRSLQLTSSIEGHGFTLAVGNFDGALLRWGVVGFTMAAGEVQKIVLGVNAANPSSVTNAFGDQAQTLLNVMQDTKANQTKWANSVTLPNGSLAQPWRDKFAAFGSDPAVQQAQLNAAQVGYTVPAIRLAQQYELKSELGLALCFDIQVQNGGIGKSSAAEIAAKRTAQTAEADLLKMMAQAVADASLAKWRQDVLSRKMMIATGAGTVHGANYVLDNWGLSAAFPAAELN